MSEILARLRPTASGEMATEAFAVTTVARKMACRPRLRGGPRLRGNVVFMSASQPGGSLDCPEVGLAWETVRAWRTER